MGTTADRVIGSVPCSVLVVRRPADSPYRRIAVAIDFSERSRAAAAEAVVLFPGAEFRLVHVVPAPIPFDYALLRTGTPQQGIDSYHRARIASARRRLSEIARELARSGGEIGGTWLREGEPAAKIRRLSHGVDVIVAGAYGHGAVLRSLLGSVAQRLVREAGSDVLIARGIPPREG